MQASLTTNVIKPILIVKVKPPRPAGVAEPALGIQKNLNAFYQLLPVRQLTLDKVLQEVFEGI